MAKRLEFDIVTDPTKGIAGLKQFSSAAKKAMKEVDSSLDSTTTSAQKVAKALSGMADELETEMKGASKAAAALSTALGPELAGRANTDQIVQDLRKMGLSFDEIAADADTLAVSLKKLDTVQMSGLEQGTKRAKSNVDDLGKSAGSSRSVLANMVGNTTQDLGALGGVAGSAGVAIGQMGEYMVDAAGDGDKLGQVVSNFGKVAVPLAAIGLVTKAISDAFAENAKMAEENKKSVDDLFQAFEEGNSILSVFADTVRQTGELKFPGRDDVLGDLAKVKLSLEDFAALAAMPQDDLEAWAAAQEKVLKGTPQYEAMKNVVFSLAQANVNAAKAAELHANTVAALRLDVAGVTRGFKAFVKAQTGVEDLPKTYDAVANAIVRLRQGLPATAHQLEAINVLLASGVPPESIWAAGNDILGRRAEEIKAANEAVAQSFTDNIKAIQEWAAQTVIATADAQGAIDDLAGEFSQMGIAQDALASVFDIGDASVDFLGRVADIHDSMRDLGDFITDPKGLKGRIPDIFDPNDVDAGPFLAKIRSLRDPIQAEIENSFAAGGPEAGKATAEAFVNELFAVFKGKLSKDQIRALFNFGDLEVKLHVAVDAKDKANAEKELQILTGVAGQDPWTASIALALQEGTITPQAAKVLIERELTKADVKVPSTLKTPDTGKAKADADRFGADPRNAVAIGSTLGNTSAESKVKSFNDAQKWAGQNTVVYPSTIAPPTTTRRRSIADILRNPFGFDAGGTVGSYGGIAAERGPEILNRRYLALHPTYVSPGTRVTSRRATARILRTRGTRGLKRYDAGGVVAGGPVTVNFNGVGAIGSRFDLMRTVKRAQLDKVRLLGTRG